MGVVVLNGLIELFRWVGPVCVRLFVCVLEILAFSPVYCGTDIRAFRQAGLRKVGISISRFWLHCYNMKLAVPQAFRVPFVAKSGLVILWISPCIQPEHCSNFPQEPHLPRK